MTPPTKANVVVSLRPGLAQHLVDPGACSVYNCDGQRLTFAADLILDFQLPVPAVKYGTDQLSAWRPRHRLASIAQVQNNQAGVLDPQSEYSNAVSNVSCSIAPALSCLRSMRGRG